MPLVMYLRLYRGKVIVVWSQPLSLGLPDGCNQGTNRRRELTLVTPRRLIVALRIKASEWRQGSKRFATNNYGLRYGYYLEAPVEVVCGLLRE